MIKILNSKKKDYKSTINKILYERHNRERINEKIEKKLCKVGGSVRRISE